MSSNFCTMTASVPASGASFRWRWVLLVLAVVVGFGLGAGSAKATSVRFADVVTVVGDQLPAFARLPLYRLGVFACAGTACHPIPFQVDERDEIGRAHV